ncbi:hypothetical protein O6H91_12G000900 [Diphasiastrum complanatum]|uniref:Uncharacterized protein n=4 Tax=Diphasiastrum complanatum TaxID=34168 RepID=A0ACC2BY68_DIPCM|nr:hypothetical protein O6H91_12G000200 [Diphasiastrum complanatum]KAJ7534717.1 hypothetical protein O6H91_12G000300 [Diphasiastrum complanatum]KAJ7534730.1 hypothetical protein O6H91_12G000700 [Diphasiastrum complanatum]KAJ7534733.1 hypothetical protein O6H91_12G000900 [Diphasiastrum complanatum]
MRSLLKANFLLLSVICLSLVASSRAKDHRKARVRITNNSGRNIQPGSIYVSHKYSDDYKNQLVFGKGLQQGQTDDGNGNQLVDYTTGFLTTGRDWWYVTWVFSDTKAIYQTDPNNFRCAIDILEGAGPAALSAAAAAIAGVAACGLPPVAGCAASPLAAAGAAVAAGSLSKALLNNEKTCGFKQFILRSEDAITTGAWVTITIHAGNKLTFNAPSGNAATVYEQIEILQDGKVNIKGNAEDRSAAAHADRAHGEVGELEEFQNVLLQM